MACQRCNGFLVREILDDPSANAGIVSLAVRCINCGYIGDSVVHTNQIRPLQANQSEPLRTLRKEDSCIETPL